MQAPPEKLGSFYLGAQFDLKTATRSETPIIYDARDLTTHAVCVGMTGSGKTGLCIGLLEEAAMDRVPSIIIDPKGDMTNLLLQFPDLRPEDFRPWINEDDAARKGKTPDEFAQSTAEIWSAGLADWGVAGTRIRTLLDTVDYTVFTPGSDAGVSVNIMGSLAAPKVDWNVETESIRERIGGTVAALMGLADVQSDPVRSREAVLLSNIFEHFWRQGQDLDLAKLILAIQTPPVRQIGVFDVETFYPAKDRFDLAMAFNNMMAAPTFQAWLTGEPLDVGSFLYTADGRPRHSIFYIAHLSDSERMFFVTLLLENVLTWVRSQSGTTSLRALLYFDEIFGYFPPTAEPPSKRPLLTLMKQARAFGVGIVLVTQNPVDLDYKGLTNAGTWLIGKLQAERDKARVLEGLEGAIAEAGGSQGIDYSATINQLGNRVFLMHNVHAAGPVIFHTRWAQSYLRGPLTRPQVRTLMASRRAIGAAPSLVAASAVAVVAAEESVAAQPVKTPALDEKMSQPDAAPVEPPVGFSSLRPSLDVKVQQVFIPIQLTERDAVRQLSAESGGAITPTKIALTYEPVALGAATVRIIDRGRSINETMQKLLVAPIPDGPGSLDWDHGEPLNISLGSLLDAPEDTPPDQGPFFTLAPERANTVAELKRIANDFADWLYYHVRLQLRWHKELGVVQKPNEDERSFRMRLDQAGRERRDAEVDKLEAQYEKQLQRIEDRLIKEQQELANDKAEATSRQAEQWIGIGESVLGWFLGRRSTRAISSAASKYRMAGKASMSVKESEEEIARLTAEKAKIEEEMKERTDEIAVRWASLLDDIASEEIAPRRSDITVELLALAWLPSWVIEFEQGGRSRTATMAAYALPATE